jgi:hypothetical protein
MFIKCMTFIGYVQLIDYFATRFLVVSIHMNFVFNYLRVFGVSITKMKLEC